MEEIAERRSDMPIPFIHRAITVDLRRLAIEMARLTVANASSAGGGPCGVAAIGSVGQKPRSGHNRVQLDKAGMPVLIGGESREVDCEMHTDRCFTGSIMDSADTPRLLAQ